MKRFILFGVCVLLAVFVLIHIADLWPGGCFIAGAVGFIVSVVLSKLTKIKERKRNKEKHGSGGGD